MVMAEEVRILEMLGRPKSRPGSLVAFTRTGIPAPKVRVLMERFGFDAHQMANILGTSERTLARRMQNRQALAPVESDRLVRFLRVASHAQDVFEGHAGALAWLKADNRALGGEPPLSLLDTDAGTEQVEEVLNRIEYGVYS